MPVTGAIRTSAGGSAGAHASNARAPQRSQNAPRLRLCSRTRSAIPIERRVLSHRARSWREICGSDSGDGPRRFRDDVKARTGGRGVDRLRIRTNGNPGREALP
jgi:hypothetical protein